LPLVKGSEWNAEGCRIAAGSHQLEYRPRRIERNLRHGIDEYDCLAGGGEAING
jgi:hypothetical protein